MKTEHLPADTASTDPLDFEVALERDGTVTYEFTGDESLAHWVAQKAKPLVQAAREVAIASEAIRQAVECLAGKTMVENRVLLTYADAAVQLGTTVSGLRTRVSRGEPDLLACVVRPGNGRAVRFSARKLAEKFGGRR